MTRARSPGDKIETIEHHSHTEQLCAGDDGANGFEDQGLTSWQLTTNAVADVFGAEVLIYSGVVGPNSAFDIDKVFITDISANNETYVVELKAGSGLFAAATRIHSQYERQATAAGGVYPNIGKSPRVRCDLKIWARAKKSGAGAGTIDFLLEYHKYPSDSGDEVTS